MNNKKFFAGVLVFGLVSAGAAFAHSPMCACMENGDGTITCEGAFSDGSSAAGVEVKVEDGSGKALLQGRMDKMGEFTFRKPAVSFTFVFDGGPGHQIRVKGEKIPR